MPYLPSTVCAHRILDIRHHLRSCHSHGVVVDFGVSHMDLHECKDHNLEQEVGEQPYYHMGPHISSGQEGSLLEEEIYEDSLCHSTHHKVVYAQVNVLGIVVDCSLLVVVDLDDHSIHQVVGHNGLDQEVIADDNSEGHVRPGSVQVSTQDTSLLLRPTSATQCTTEPLNSRPSSFSTAVLRSAPVSNSTNLNRSVL